ncbi:MAG: hypothetical protein C0522_11830 [Rhodocyclaceae bacterium]|jgi:hypothetical protein|nr:hypothetical protein [Rhodocyclaceae bacterium]
MDDSFLDCTRWQAMLDREGIPAADAYIGVLGKDDFASRQGKLLVWRGTKQAVLVSLLEYNGEQDADVAMLLVADDDALQSLLAEGLAMIPLLVRRGKLQPYMLKTMNELEVAGLADFVEDLGLIFPKH